MIKSTDTSPINKETPRVIKFHTILSNYGQNKNKEIENIMDSEELMLPIKKNKNMVKIDNLFQI